MQHLRYRYSMSQQLDMEVFLQNARDPFKRINSRKLAGTGPRYQLHSNYPIFLGVAFMKEEESISANAAQQAELRNYMRASVSINAKFHWDEKLSLDTSAYWQPSSINNRNYRFINESGLDIKLFDRLSWRVVFQTSYDSEPAELVRKFDQKIEQAISLSF